MDTMGSSEISNLADSFNNTAETYEGRMGTATRAVACHLVSLLRLPPNAVVCDNACGTGAVTEAVLQHDPNAHVFATDSSPGMVDILSRTGRELGWANRVTAQLQDSVNLDYPENCFDAHIMSFGIFFTSQEVKTASEIYRTLKDGGTAIVTCWKESALFQLIFDVQKLIKPADLIQQLPMLERWSDPETMVSVLKEGGFSDPKMTAYPVDLTRGSLSELVEACADNFKGMVGDRWTKEEKERIEWATKHVLLMKPEEYLSVDEPDCKGIRWVAWIATASR